MELNKRLYGEIDAFCQENGLETEKYITNLLRRAFATELYGSVPGEKEKNVEEKVPKEKKVTAKKSTTTKKKAETKETEKKKEEPKKVEEKKTEKEVPTVEKVPEVVEPVEKPKKKRILK